MKRILLALVLISAAIAVTGQTAESKAKAKEKDLKSRNASVERKQRELKKELGGVVDEKLDVRAEVKRLDTLANAADARLEEIRADLRKGRARQEELMIALDRAAGRMASFKDKLKARVRSMYMSGEESMLLVLLGSKDAADFASRRFLMERIASRDEALFRDVRQLHEEIKAKKDEQDELVKGILALEKQNKEKLAELEKARAEKNALLTKIKQEQAVFQGMLDELEEESRKIEGEIGRLQAAYASSGGPIVRGTGRFIRPVQGRLTSPFGPRRHPIRGGTRMHAGQDFGAPTGTPILAADSGNVIFAGWRGGYGNTVMVDHGNGLVTLYGHCSRLFVRVGQGVRQGQRIAAVGSTGASTGPHLHFEVRVNGVARDPRAYL